MPFIIIIIKCQYWFSFAYIFHSRIKYTTDEKGLKGILKYAKKSQHFLQTWDKTILSFCFYLSVPLCVLHHHWSRLKYDQLFITLTGNFYSTLIICILGFFWTRLSCKTTQLTNKQNGVHNRGGLFENVIYLFFKTSRHVHV